MGTIGDCMGVVWIIVVHLPNKRGWFVVGRKVLESIRKVLVGRKAVQYELHSCTQCREDPEAKIELGLPLFVAESHHNVFRHSKPQLYPKLLWGLVLRVFCLF